MSEYKNPFDPKNFYTGPDRAWDWDGKVVTITKFCSTRRDWVDGAGNPVIGRESGQPVFTNEIQLTGIPEGTDIERTQSYTLGNNVFPTPDGEGLMDKEGRPCSVHKSSNAARLSEAFVNSGFDINLLFDEKTGRGKMSALVGAKFLFKGFPSHDQSGNVKLDKKYKKYEVLDYYPVRFEGYSTTVKAASATTGNGEDVRDKAINAVTEVLVEAGTRISRVDLIKKLSTKLAKDADANKILALVSKPSFHQDVPWTSDGTGFSL